MNDTAFIIPVSQGQSAIVSPEDFEYLSQWSWSLLICKHKHCETLYAIRRISPTAVVMMHNEVAKRAGLPKSKYYDHKDKNGLRNTRDNLRPATRSQQCMNRRKWGTTSKFKWVCWHKKNRTWTTKVQKDGKPQYLGSYKDELEAAAVGAAFAIFYHGEYACFE